MADRPPGSQQQPAYSDRGDSRIPGAGIVYPNDDRAGLRPPGAIGAAPGATGALPQPQQPAVGADGRPVQLAALPPEEQPEVGPAQLPPHLRRQEVSFATKEPAGTIVVDTSNTHLYYVLGGGRAIRYGVRVGRDGFTWNGVQKVSRKAEWPDWHPPTEMIERQPYLPRFMAGGPGNPLGARAMYLGSTIYRIHGTNQPSTIGKFVSSGCIGMLNEDVSDLFERAKVGTRVVVMPGGAPPANTASASAARRRPLARCRSSPWTGFTGPTGARSRRAADGGAAAARPGHDPLTGRLSNKHLRRAESAPFCWGMGAIGTGSRSSRSRSPDHRPRPDLSSAARTVFRRRHIRTLEFTFASTTCRAVATNMRITPCEFLLRVPLAPSALSSFRS